MTTKEHLDIFLLYNKKSLKESNYQLIKYLSDNNLIKSFSHEYRPNQIFNSNTLEIEIFGEKTIGKIIIAF